MSIGIVVTETIRVEGLGDRLKSLRENKGLTQKELGNRLKCRDSYISRIESNFYCGKLSLEQLLRIIKTMGYPVPKSPKITSKQEILEFLDSLDS